MNTTQRRRLSARLLLAVYLPLLLLTMVHMHRSAGYVEDVCVQCVHHEPHAGHFTAQTASMHECVLCQLTTLTYVLPSAVFFSVLLTVSVGSMFWQVCRVPSTAVAHQSSRAPPFASHS